MTAKGGVVGGGNGGGAVPGMETRPHKKGSKGGKGGKDGDDAEAEGASICSHTASITRLNSSVLSRSQPMKSRHVFITQFKP